VIFIVHIIYTKLSDRLQARIAMCSAPRSFCIYIIVLMKKYQ